MGGASALSVRTPQARRGRRSLPARQEVSRIATAIEAYAPSLRGRLTNFARRSPRNTDLLYSFPAAAVAIATDHGPPALRGEAMWQVRVGAPLAEIANALGLPLWMRRLPPDCFDGPFPQTVPEFEPLLRGKARVSAADDSAFGRRVLPSMPVDRVQRPRWLEAVLIARAHGDDDFAAWVAREFSASPQGEPIAALRLIAMYAYASRHGEGRVAAAVGRAWTPRLSFLRAAEETARWYRRLIHLSRRVEDPASEACAADWRRTHRIGRFEIRPILTAGALRAEALALRNCLRQYEAEVLEGRSLLFAVQAGGRSVAALELMPMLEDPSRLAIAQLKGVANGAPPRGARYAVARWMADRPPFPWRLLYEHAVESVDRHAWIENWRPYLRRQAEIGAASWAPMTPRSGLSRMQLIDRYIADCRPHSS